MTATDLTAMRAARHLALPQIGSQGQERIASATVLLIGLGGIGCAAASYLASAGVGRLLLSDFDTVDASNLGRQILYGPTDIGELKAECAARRLGEINPDIQLTAIVDRLHDATLSAAVYEADIVLDGCDNFATRFAVSDACVGQQRKLVFGSAIRFEAQLGVFGPDYEQSPCYRCLYTEADESFDDYAGQGVLAPVPGVVGTMMAVEALKHLAGVESTSGRLTLYDAITGDWRQITVGKRDGCPGCGSR